MRIIHNILIAFIAGLVLPSCLKEDYNTATGTPGSVATIDVLRSAWRGQSVTLNADHLNGAGSITGVVISDRNGGNMETGIFALQSTIETPNQLGPLTRGILIDLGGAAVPYDMGDELVIDIVGATLNRVNGKLMVSGITPDRIGKKASNVDPVVRPVTIGMLNYDFEKYESTVVSLHADVSGHTPGDVYGGDKLLDDHTSGQLVLRTDAGASFAGNNIPVNAQFTGIAAYHNEGKSDTTGAIKVITMRNDGDVQYESGPLYAGFPEKFEFPDASQKPSYNMTAISNNIDLATGNWKLQQALLGTTFLRDKYNPGGRQCIRMQQNLTAAAYVQMNFDVTEGASKVTVFYGKYYTDPTSTFQLEYSVNGGADWTVVPGTVSDMPESGSKQATFILDVDGTVRFRIHKLGLGTSSATVSNGRLCIEDIAVYKKG